MIARHAAGPSGSTEGSPEHYRAEAERVRAMARRATAGEIKIQLLSVADQYEVMAKAVERRMKMGR
jgi:hypothetical protein